MPWKKGPIPTNEVRIRPGRSSKVPLLSADEETSLARAARAGDTRAREALIVGNLRFAFSFAKGWRRRSPWVPLADLIQEANVGLVMAADRFDPDAGVRFVTYAGYWIMQHLYRCGQDHRTIPVPIDLACKAGRVLKGEPTPDGDPARLRAALDCREVASLDDPEMRTRDEPFLDDSADPAGLASRRDECARVRARLETLPDRWRFVLDQRFGLTSGVGATLSAVGAQLGITKERVRQVELRALEGLRKALEGDDE
jgi:RNA polymerase sigma factor (sigma-70 family)